MSGGRFGDFRHHEGRKQNEPRACQGKLGVRQGKGQPCRGGMKSGEVQVGVQSEQRGVKYRGMRSDSQRRRDPTTA